MANQLNEALTSFTAKRVDWPAIDDVFALLTNRSRRVETAASVADAALSERERETARKAFEVARSEFAKTLGRINGVMRWSTVGIFAAVALAIAGGVLVQVSPWASVISIASVGSLFALLPKCFGLARDQAMLELIPARYALALELCRSRHDLQNLVSRFLDETTSLRSSTPRSRQASKKPPTVSAAPKK